MILVLAEHDRGALNELSLQGLSFGRSLAAGAGEPLEAVVVGAEAKAITDVLGDHGASTVHIAEHERLTDFAPAAWAAAVADVMERTHTSIVLASGSDRGNVGVTCDPLSPTVKSEPLVLRKIPPSPGGNGRFGVHTRSNSSKVDTW